MHDRNPEDITDDAPAATMEMPRYVSHKRVWALEIATADPMLCKLTFVDKGYAPIKTDADVWARYKPVPGDFYVVYADGYKSFSPRKAFLEGYKMDTVPDDPESPYGCAAFPSVRITSPRFEAFDLDAARPGRGVL